MALSALTVRGPFRGPSGYDHHVREFVRELHNQGVAIELVDLAEWSPAILPPRMRDPWFDSLHEPCGSRTVLQFCMPQQVIRYGEKINVNYTMFEATRIHRSWVSHSRKHDLIILPTESSRRAWISSGVPEDRIRLCPLGINPDLFCGTATPMQLRRDNGEPVSQYRVRFLNVSELGPRKNLIGLLRAWMTATCSRDDAVLVIKLGCYAPGRLEWLFHELKSVELKLGKRLNAAAPVHFVYDVFSDADMPRLYAAATHYISMSHGEGWDQTTVEAAASGLKLIVPKHSSYQTYLDASVASLISSREVPVVFPGDVETARLFENAHWWEPDELEAAAYIRSAIDGLDGGKASARERILTQFTWEKATRQLMAILGELETGKNRRWFFLWRRLSRSARIERTRSSPNVPGTPDPS